jgi:hypothetical protein
MNISTSVPLKMNQEVIDFLREKQVEGAFETMCRLAEECYPALHSLEAELQDDVDEEGRRYVLVQAFLPEDYPLEKSQQEVREFNRKKGERIPWSAGRHLSHITWRR